MSKRKLSNRNNNRNNNLNIYLPNEPWNASFPKRPPHLTGIALKKRENEIKRNNFLKNQKKKIIELIKKDGVRRQNIIYYQK